MRSALSVQRGLAALETAVLVLSIVGAASVLGAMVITLGVNKSEQTRQVIDPGFDNSTSGLFQTGAVLAKDLDNDRTVDEIVLTLGSVLTESASIDFTTTADTDGDGLLSDEALSLHTTIVSYVDHSVAINDLAWTVEALGRHDGDDLLEPGERFLMTVSLDALPASKSLGASGTFTIKVLTTYGGTITYTKTIPPVVTEVMVLN